MTTDQVEMYCKPCAAHYLGDPLAATNPCPQCGAEMEQTPDEPGLDEFLAGVVDDVIAQVNDSTPSLDQKVAYAQMLALVKIAYELERITP